MICALAILSLVDSFHRITSEFYVGDSVSCATGNGCNCGQTCDSTYLRADSCPDHVPGFLDKLSLITFFCYGSEKFVVTGDATTCSANIDIINDKLPQANLFCSCQNGKCYLRSNAASMAVSLMNHRSGLRIDMDGRSNLSRVAQ